jgi:two-component system, LuxR family, response regulator FixJ
MSRVGTVQPALSGDASYGPVYLLDDDHDLRACLVDALVQAGLVVRSFASTSALLSDLGALGVGCIVTGMPPESSEAEALRRELAARVWPFPIVAITPPADVGAAVRAMKLGAVDVVPRPVHPADLVAAVKAALARDRIDRQGLNGVHERLGRLTRRERQVLEGMVRGEASKAIAFNLGISPRTVEVHRAKVMEKLGCRSLPEIVRLTMQAGLAGA